MHVRNMWEPTGWDSPETAFDLDQEDVDTVIANLAPQRMVKVKVEKAETIVVRAEKSTECTHVSNPSLPPSPPTCTDDVADAVHMLSEKNDDLQLVVACNHAEIASLKNSLEVAQANIKGAVEGQRFIPDVRGGAREGQGGLRRARPVEGTARDKDSIISGLQRRNTELSLANAETIKAKNDESGGTNVRALFLIRCAQICSWHRRT